MSRRQAAAAYREPEGRQNEYFLPAEGISREVIQADICRYLGNDALVRRGQLEGRDGYLIRAYRNLTTQMIADLKADSERWEAESSRRAMRGQAPVAYEQTGIHDDRQRHGPSQPTSQGGYPGGQPQYMSQQDYAAHEYGQPQGISQYGQPTPGGRGDYATEPAYSYQPGGGAYPQSQQAGLYDYPSRDGYDSRDPRDTRDPRDPRDLRDTRDPRDPRSAIQGYESAHLGGARTTAGYPASQQPYQGAISGHPVHQSAMQGQHGYVDPNPSGRGYAPDPYGARPDPRYDGSTRGQQPRRR